MAKLIFIVVLLISLGLSGPAKADDHTINSPVCGPTHNVREWLVESGMREVMIGRVTDLVMASLWRSDERFAFFTQHVNGAACIHALGLENWFVEPVEEAEKKKANFEIRSMPDGSNYVWVGVNVQF